MDEKLFMMSKKKSERRKLKVYYDKTNNVAVAQWHNNKVVTVVSTIGVNGKLPFQQRKESIVLDLTTESCARKYQLGMGGVDRGD